MEDPCFPSRLRNKICKYKKLLGVLQTSSGVLRKWLQEGGGPFWLLSRVITMGWNCAGCREAVSGVAESKKRCTFWCFPLNAQRGVYTEWEVHCEGTTESKPRSCFSGLLASPISALSPGNYYKASWSVAPTYSLPLTLTCSPTREQLIIFLFEKKYSHKKSTFSASNFFWSLKSI